MKRIRIETKRLLLRKIQQSDTNEIWNCWMRDECYSFSASDWAVFTAKGPMPGSLQNLNTAVWQEWFPNDGQKNKANGSFLKKLRRKRTHCLRRQSRVWKNIWGSVIINDRGQIIIPKAARDKFGFIGGQRLIVLSDEKEGIALIPAEIFEAKIEAAMQHASFKPE